MHSSSPAPAASSKADILRRTGELGEELACRHLESLGYTVLHRNLRSGRRGEIDIVAHDPGDDVIVFAEVKTRSVLNDYRPEMNLTRRKRKAMMKAARAWIIKTQEERGYRMDLICVAERRVVDHWKELSWED